MVPAQQRLHAAHLAVREPDLRLVVQRALVVRLNRLAQLTQELHVVDPRLVTLAAVPGHRGAGVLRDMQRGVRAPHQEVRTVSVARVERDPDASLHGDGLTVHRHRLLDRGKHALAEIVCRSDIRRGPDEETKFVPVQLRD